MLYTRKYKYKYMKKELYRAFYDSSSRVFHNVNSFFAVVTIIAVVSISFETVSSLNRYSHIFATIEYVTVTLFLVEYIARVIAAKKPLAYIFSFFGIIDLLSIVPTFLGLANFSFLKTARFIRILRVFRILRLFRFTYDHFKDTQKVITDENDVHSKSFWLKVEMYIIIFTIAALLSASAIYFAEGERSSFANIPMALLWSTKVLLGGVYSQGVQTVMGEVVVIITRCVGLILFGLLVNIVGGALQKLLFGSKSKS